MINDNTTRFKYIWFVLFYITFIFVAIIYSYQVFTNANIKQVTWQDVASYDFDLVDQTFEGGVLTNTYGISTPEQLAGVFMINESAEKKLNSSSLVYADTITNIGSQVQTINNEYVLLNDVNMSGMSWTPSSTFSGIFNGNYHVISNLSIESSNYAYIGMVRRLYGTIKNLFLKYIYISNDREATGESGSGSVAGECYGNISNVTVLEGVVNGPFYYDNSDRKTGGIAGSLTNNGTITNCINYATVGFSKFSGGIVGVQYNGIIKNCYNYGSISNGTNDWPRAGGICGESKGGTIELCVNYGSVTSIRTPEGGGDVKAGGIVGHATQPIEQCANYGKIEAGTASTSKSFAGGIVGYTTSSIKNCYNRGEIVANAKQTKTYDTSYVNYNNYEVEDLHYFHRLIEEIKIMGFIKIGEINGFYYYYYIKGNANNDKEKIERTISSEYAYAGGIAGNVSNDNANSANISYCYSTSKVDGGKVQYDDVYAFVLYYFSKVVESSNLGNNYSTAWVNNAVIYYLQLKYDYTYFYNPIIGAVNESSSSSGLTNTYGIYDYNNSTSASYNCTKYSYEISGRNTMYDFGVSYVDRMSELYSDEDTTSDEKDIGSGTITTSKTISLDSSLFSVENISDVKIYVNLAKSNNRLTVQAQFKSNNKQEKRTLTKNSYTYTNKILASGYTKKTVSTLKSVSLGSLWSQSDSLNDGYPYLNGLYW